MKEELVEEEEEKVKHIDDAKAGGMQRKEKKYLVQAFLS